MEQQTGSKEEKENVKAVYCHPAYLTYLQSTAGETLGWKKHKLESRWENETMSKGKFKDLWEIDGETVERVSDFIFFGSKITADGDWSHEIKRRLLLERKLWPT